MANKINNKEPYTCQICFEPCEGNRALADTDHKVHTFCIECLQNWAKESNARNQVNNGISCPTCKLPIRKLKGEDIIPAGARPAGVVNGRAFFQEPDPRIEGPLVPVANIIDIVDAGDEVALRRTLREHPPRAQVREQALIRAVSSEYQLDRLNIVKALLENAQISAHCRIEAIRIAKRAG